jgi:hypothetical protein
MRASFAQWVGPSPNCDVGGMGTPVQGLVLHIMQGSIESCINWFKDPQSQVSAHFLNPKTGALCQMVDTADKAWAQTAGNEHWISVEHEGYSGDSLTDNQITNDAALVAWLSSVYNFPLVSTNDPNSYGLGWHGMGGIPWGDHPLCPGVPIINQRDQILVLAKEEPIVQLLFKDYEITVGADGTGQSNKAADGTILLFANTVCATAVFGEGPKHKGPPGITPLPDGTAGIDVFGFSPGVLKVRVGYNP